MQETQGVRPQGSPAERALAGSRGLRLSQVWVAAALAFPLAVLTTMPLNAIDLAYQVRAGEVMLSTHTLLRTDVFTFTAAGAPWLNQPWGAELVLAAIYGAGGWLGLAVARAVLAATALGLLLLACRAAGASLRGAAWLTLASGSLLLIPNAFQLRAQLLGVVCFAAVLWLVAGRRRYPSRLWWAVPVITVWANVHGTFFLGPLLIGLGWLQDQADRVPQARRVAPVVLAGLAATVVSPFGPRVWEYVVDVTTDPLVRGLVSEWRRPSLDTYAGASFLISAAAVAAYLARRGFATPWPALISLGVFFGLGLSSNRATVWWALAMPVVLAGLPRPHRAVSARSDQASPLNTGVAAVLAIVTLAAFVRWLPYRGDDPPAGLVTFAPVGITHELEVILAPGEVWFNPQNWGSWFELALPANPVMVDSRFEVVPQAAWNDYWDVSHARHRWQEILDRWRIDIVVLAPDQQRALIPVMGSDPGWRLVYEDDDGLIFTRS